MCGICGIYSANQQVDPDVVNAMATSMRHRGPDDNGTWIKADGSLSFAHNRLSIIDLSDAGHQPIVSESKNTVLCYNGELYNFKALRVELEGLGHRFKSECDTEVVLHAFDQWGEAALERFCGMFALAVWFAKENKLLLARDPLGMKPLYYWQHEDTLVFASEIKAFFKHPDFSPEIDERAIQQFVEFGYCFDRERTSLKGISKLPPASKLIAANGTILELSEYYKLPNASRDMNVETSCELFSQEFKQVVQEHMVADVPVAVLLSGGLDSSLIAATAASEGTVNTLTMGFKDSSKDERSHARLVADHIRSNHHELLIDTDEAINSMEEAAWVFDDIFADWGTLTTRLLYKKAADQGIKVVLVGEGSDEIFGGYPAFKFANSMQGREWLKRLRLYQKYSGQRYGSFMSDFFRQMTAYRGKHDGSWFDALRRFETQDQLPNNYVMKVDKASMSVSVEARAPFLDRRVVDFAFQCPSSVLLKDNTEKWILRKMAEEQKLLPSEALWRRKEGGSIAMDWMHRVPEFRQYAKALILVKGSLVDRLGYMAVMKDYFERDVSGYRFPSKYSILENSAWRLLLLNLWAKAYSI